MKALLAAVVDIVLGAVAEAAVRRLESLYYALEAVDCYSDGSERE